MKNTITNSFKAALWSIALVFGMMACTQMEQDTINETSFPEKMAFVKSNGLNGMNFRTVTDGDICGSEEFCMLAGQKELAGAGYTVSNDEDYVYFTIFTEGDWFISEAHLTYGSNFKTMPGVGKNNVAPGQFIEVEKFAMAKQDHTFKVSIEDLPTTFDFAFHGVVLRIGEDETVHQGETSYTCGDRIHAKGVWATYNTYTIAECEDDDTEIEEKCDEDTAFAGTTGSLLDNQGWYYLMTLEEGSATGTLFAGKTKEAGMVTITTEGDNVKVNIVLKDGFSLQSGDNVYVHGYTTAPTVRPIGGQPGTSVTYAKQAATSSPINITLPKNGASIFAVHVNVQECK